MLGIISKLVVFAMSIAAGLGAFSFWWVLIPVFFAGSLGLSNSHHYDSVMTANQRGSVTFMPLMLSIYCGGALALGGITYWITTWFR